MCVVVCPNGFTKKKLTKFCQFIFCSVVQEKVCRITCVRRTCLRIVVVSQCFDVIIRHNGSTQWFDEIQQSARITCENVSSYSNSIAML